MISFFLIIVLIYVIFHVYVCVHTTLGSGVCRGGGGGGGGGGGLTNCKCWPHCVGQLAGVQVFRGGVLCQW